MITPFEYEVLRHASDNGRYITGDKAVLAMADKGLLFDYGPQALAAGDHYLTTSMKGRAAINEYRASLPKPLPIKQRRCSEAFAAWRRYCDACGRVGFPEFLKKVWPHRREWA